MQIHYITFFGGVWGHEESQLRGILALLVMLEFANTMILLDGVKSTK